MALGVHETQTYQRPILARRNDDAALAVVDDDVGAIGLGEAWCALEEFFSVHISEDGVNYRSKFSAQSSVEPSASDNATGTGIQFDHST